MPRLELDPELGPSPSYSSPGVSGVSLGSVSASAASDGVALDAAVLAADLEAWHVGRLSRS